MILFRVEYLLELYQGVLNSLVCEIRRETEIMKEDFNIPFAKMGSAFIELKIPHDSAYQDLLL